MKWWLIVYVLSPDGLTSFDIEYDSRAECNAALEKTQEIVIPKYPDGGAVVCRPFPLPERLPDDSEVEV